MHNAPKPSKSRPLAIVRALALVAAAPACVTHEEIPPPPPYNGGSSGGGVVVQGGVVQGNNVVVTQDNVVRGDEQNVEMHTVVTGQHNVCAVGAQEMRGSALCTCIATTGGAAWQCAAVARGECVLGTSENRGIESCSCVSVANVARWLCHPNRYHVVGPLAPPELAVDDVEYSEASTRSP
ncbi:MAG: hypothetical protein JNK05_27745 [Myxococcales bacterium]|nr:hypothetical protein [Myxococcales bacterium]